MADDALFLPDGPGTFVPTSAAGGAWDTRIVHGAAVAALFAGQLTPVATDDEPARTLARLTVDFLAPVPLGPLTLERSERTGGSRVQRQHATLCSEGRAVASASAVVVARGAIELPDAAREHLSPFDPAAVPPLDEPNRKAEELVGWPSFDSRSLILAWMKVPDDPRPHQWITLAMPVVAGTELLGTELAAVAADYGQTAVSWQLPYDQWSFRNAELTLHLSREPVGSWIGIRSECVAQPVGSGFNTADLFDADGRVGRSAAALVIERRGERHRTGQA